MSFKIVEDPRFTKKIENLEKFLPRISEFKKGLYATLQNDPFIWGTPVPKRPIGNTVSVSWEGLIQLEDFPHLM